MVVELRKRKVPAQPPVLEKKPKTAPKSGRVTKSKAPSVKKADVASSKTATPSLTAVPTAGETIDVNGFGGEIENNDGEKTSLKDLLDASEAGVVLFTYPRASTPGCTKQVCLFRDNYDDITSAGFSVYGLSTDSPKANTTFKTKQKLSYPLLCDTSATLIGAIGFKKAPKGTTRGVFAVDKEGKVLLLQPGGPDGTVEAVKKLIAEKD